MNNQRGQAVTDASGAVNHILGGWQTNGILVMQSGVPLSVSTTNTSYAGNAVLRPNNNGQSARLEGDCVDRLDKFFRTEVFTQPALYTFGNTGRNLPVVSGPGLTSLDCSQSKNI